MAYLHIDNLYKDPTILQFRECYALEKIHGTSANIRWDGHEVWFSSGGENHEKFVALFDAEDLKQKFAELSGIMPVVVYGEAYGGKQQGMKETYGPELKFVVFEVKFGKEEGSGGWQTVWKAEEYARKLGLDFVYWTRIPCDLEHINAERDMDSVQAIRNGMGSGKMREGIVLRTVGEFRDCMGTRIIAKHKRDEFRETKTPRVVDPEKALCQFRAGKAAEEFVTEMRLDHVLDKMPGVVLPDEMGKVIAAMWEDVAREGTGEIVEDKALRSAVGKKTAQLVKARLGRGLEGR